MKKTLIFLLKAAVSVGLISWFLLRHDLTQVLHLFGTLSLGVFVLINILNLIDILFDTFQWWVLVPGARFLNLLRANLVTQYYALVLPGQLVGEVGKVWYLRKFREQSLERIAASIGIDKLTGLLGAVFIVGTAGAYERSIPLPPIVPWAFICGFLLTASVVFLLRLELASHFSKRALAFFFAPFRGVQGMRDRLYTFIDECRGFSQNTSQMLISTFFGCLYQLLAIIITMTIASNFGIQVPFFDWCWIVSGLSLLLLLPISLAGLGVREAGFIGLLSLFAIPASAALALSLVLSGLQIVLALVGFFVSLIPIREANQNPPLP